MRNHCKRVSARGRTRPYNKFFCRGQNSAFRGAEAWSTTKNFAAANAAGTMRNDVRPFGDFGLGLGCNNSSIYKYN